MAPSRRGQKNSHDGHIKTGVVFSGARESWLVRAKADCIHCRRLMIAECVITTPLGFPVDPEV